MKHTRRKSSMWCDTVVWLCLLTFFAPAPFVTTTLPSVVLFCSSLVAFTRLIHVVVRWPFSVFASLTCIVGAHSSEAGANPYLGRYNIATANVTTRTRSKKRNRLKLAIGPKDVVLQLQREKENNKRSRTNTVCFETCLLDLRSANVWHFYALCPRNRSNLLVRVSAWARPLWAVLRGQLQQKILLRIKRPLSNSGASVRNFASEFRARASGDSSAVCWYWNRNYSPQRMWRMQECDQVHVALRPDLRKKCGIETPEGRSASDCATSTTTKCTRPVSRLRTKQHTALWLSKGSFRNIF